MILFLYTALASVILVVAYPAALLMALFGRKTLIRRLVPPHDISGDERQCIWIHGASVGESIIAFSMAGEIKRKHPDAFICVSINTVTGYSRLEGMMSESEEKNPIDRIFFAPFDHPLITNLFVRRIRPKVYIIVETEIWPCLIRSIHRAGIPVSVINGKLSRKSFRRYYTFRYALRKTARMISLVCVQSRSFARRFYMLGVPRECIEVLGNVKFDSLPDRSMYDTAAQRGEMGIPVDARVVVAGSTRPGEERVIFQALIKIRERYPDTVLICAPRHLNRVSEVEEVLKETGLAFMKRSSGEIFNASKCGVLLLDTMGELIDAFVAADVAFVGGSLRDFGGHNPMEPAALGVPVLFGPYMEQTGSKELLAGGAASLVHDDEELAEVVGRLFSDEELSSRMSEAGPQVVERFKGTLARTLRLMENRGIL